MQAGLFHGGLCCAVLATYVLSMQLAGVPYAAATALFIPILAIAVGARTKQSIATVAVIGLAVACACFFVFTKVLIIDLP